MYCCNALQKKFEINPIHLGNYSIAPSCWNLNECLIVDVIRTARCSSLSTNDFANTPGKRNLNLVLFLMINFFILQHLKFLICKRDSARGSVTWTVRNRGYAWYNNASYTILSFIHWSRSTLVVIMPKISSYTRTRIELLFNLKKNQSWFSGGLKVAPKINQFWAQNNVKMKWI